MQRLAMQCTAERRRSTSLWPGSPYFTRIPFRPRRSGRCWRNKSKLSYQVTPTEKKNSTKNNVHIETQRFKDWLNTPYPLTLDSIGVQYRGEREQDLWVCPCAARVQSAYTIWHESIQRLLVHNNLRTSKVQVFTKNGWTKYQCLFIGHKTGICNTGKQRTQRTHGEHTKLHRDSNASSGSLWSGNASHRATHSDVRLFATVTYL